MSFFHALILGILQGITEFFPVSSSAHLKLAQLFFYLPEKDILLSFDLICHLGTLLALCFFAGKEALHFFFEKKNIRRICLAILPLVPMYFLPFRHMLQGPIWIGVFLLFTAALLFLSSRTHAISTSSSLKKRDVFLVGCMQALALLPGISRSGSTISMGCFRKWPLEKAVRFSFFLSIPTVLGGNVLEIGKAYLHTTTPFWTLPISLYVVGFLTSFGIGSLCVRWIFSLRDPQKLQRFAWYCLALGIFTMLYVSYAN